MSERLSLHEVLRDYGTPLVTLGVKASEEECLKLRERLLSIRNLSEGKEQGYLEVSCSFYVDVHDIDRYLSGELPNLAEIYTFPEDVKSHKEE
ncbi:hypothetical protein Ga0466249_000597 [Sporomusaceae bacterium BoRhaA]|uniref:hypothetical protein n=1 Tax=Pelorhabdus rhamnosifermentans TaxID=2772457 RepID=UPI001C06090D|nr:hypothetical protein [Pelorhabdus rhamnosifermentans]MBU2699518.1 hypothetical protein [Pelorhabdus rhamnosifermentans]